MREEEQKALVEAFQRVMKDVRAELGWTAVQLAAMLDVSRQTISNLETGRQPMSWVQFLAFAAIADFATEGKEEQRTRILQMIDGASAGNMWYTPIAKDGSLLLRPLTGVLREATDPSQTALLTNLAEHSKVFLDGNVFFADGAAPFFATFLECLQKADAQVILPFRALQDIEKNASDARTRALAIVRNLQKSGYLSIRGEEFDPGTQDTIRSVFMKFRSRYKLCLLTQDEAFAQKVLHMNEDLPSSQSDPIEVYHLVDGTLRAYETATPGWLEPKREQPTSWDDLFADEPQEKRAAPAPKPPHLQPQDTSAEEPQGTIQLAAPDSLAAWQTTAQPSAPEPPAPAAEDPQPDAREEDAEPAEDATSDMDKWFRV